MKISDYSIKHPVIITISLVAVIVFGFISLFSMNRDMLPRIASPMANIITIYPGVGAKDVEKEVTEVLENQLATLTGVKEMASVSRDSASIISLEFNPGANLYEIIPTIREKINRVRGQLPDGIQGEPAIYTAGSENLPIFTVKISSPMERDRLTTYLNDELIPLIARVKGVSQVNLKGGSEREVEIRLHLDQLSSKGIAALQIYQLLKMNNISTPAGETVYRDKELHLRTVGEFANLDELRNLVVGYKDGSFIYLKDVADVTFKTPEPEFYVLTAGKDMQLIDVLKRSDGDTMHICASIKETLQSFEKEANGAVKFSILKDDSVMVDTSIGEVLKEGRTGIILTLIVLLFFMHNFRTVLIIGVAIPLAFVISFIGMNLMGMTLNILSLSGIIVAIGMVVDCPVVILQAIHRNFLKTGDAALAASRGSEMVAGAVIASTTTSVSVYLPLIFLTGVIGIVMKEISLTIVFAHIASTLVAILVVPMLASKFMKPIERDKRSKFLNTVTDRIDGLVHGLEEGYRRLIELSLSNKKFVILLAGIVFLLSIASMSVMGLEFLPPSDSAEFEIYVTTPQGFTLSKTREKVNEIEARMRQLIPEITDSAFYVGAESPFSGLATKNKAFGRFQITPVEKRKRSVFDVIKVLQRSLRTEIPDASITIVNGGFDSLLAMASGGRGYRVQITGNDFEELSHVAKQVKVELEKDPEVYKAELDINLDVEEVVTRLMLDYMGTLGVTPYEAAISSRIFFNGLQAGKFREGKKGYDINLTSDINGKPINENSINQIVVKSQSGRTLSFANFSRMEVLPAFSQINHQNRVKQIVVTAFMNKEETSGLDKRFQEKRKLMNLPRGVKFDFGGSSSLMKDSLVNMLLILSVSVFLVYMVMVIQFERYLHPLVIMGSIPFCIIGVTAGLLLFNSSLSIFAFLGIITLVGVVVANAIVMVDYINFIRDREGIPLREAVIVGGSTRLEPILMTTLSTVLAVIPMAFGKGNGAEIYAPLGQSIAGGLITSTLITLVLIPVLYYLLESRLTARRERKARG